MSVQSQIDRLKNAVSAAYTAAQKKGATMPSAQTAANLAAAVQSIPDATAMTVDSALSGTSTNPVQNRVVKAALDGKLDKSGGTLTGNLTGKYFSGTWLQTTAASDLGSTPGKVAVLDGSGWVYYRTPAELLGDMGVKDYIVEQGSSGNWTYRKWSNGDAECWASATVSGMACTTTVGNWYRTGNITISNYPFTFTVNPNLQMTFETYSGTGGLVWSAGTSSSSPKTKPATVYVIRPTSSNSITGFVRYYAKGKWK